MKDGILRVVVAGELDVATAALLDAAPGAAEARAVDSILLDIAAVSFIDASELKALSRAVERSVAASVQRRAAHVRRDSRITRGISRSVRSW